MAMTLAPVSTKPQHRMVYNPPSESDDEPEFVNMEAKVLCPQNKKDYHMCTLRHITRDACGQS